MQMFDPTASNKDTAIPEFYIEHVITGDTDGDGVPIVQKVEMVRIINPGDQLNVPCIPVRDEHRKRFALSYEAFTKGQEPPEDGMPLEVWPGINKGEVAMCKSKNIKTVEALANVSEATLPNRLHDLHHRAAVFLKSAEGGKIAEELRKENTALKRRVTMLEKNVATQKEIISAYELKDKREAS